MAILATSKITLTDVPQKVAAGECYLQSSGGEFNFALGEAEPTNLDISHSDSKLYTNGNFGSVWAWKSVHTKVVLIVSKKDGE